jgi:hypothetical protein
MWRSIEVLARVAPAAEGGAGREREAEISELLYYWNADRTCFDQAGEIFDYVK